MKKTLSILLSLVLTLSALPLTAVNSFAEESGDWAYEVYNTDEIKLTDYYGTAKTVTIPSFLDGCVVTAIGYNTFISSDQVENVIIPDCIRIIESKNKWSKNSTFSNCINLESITVSELNDNYSSVDGVLFNKDKTELIRFPTKKTSEIYTIPDSVSCIYNDAFLKCVNLSSVVLPSGITTLGNNMFQGCSSLETVSIPKSVTSIGSNAFQDCVELRDITIPESVESIESGAFMG